MIVYAAGQVQLPVEGADGGYFLSRAWAVDIMLNQEQVAEGVGRGVVGETGIVEEGDTFSARNAVLQGEG